MLKIYYNLAEPGTSTIDSILQILSAESSLEYQHHAQLASVVFSSEEESIFHNIINAFHEAIESHSLQGVFITTLAEVELHDKQFIQGIIATTELKSLYLNTGTWEDLGVLPIPSGMVEAASLQPHTKSILRKLSRSDYLNQLNQFLVSDQLTTLHLSANSGMGKTTLINQFLEKKNYQFTSFKNISSIQQQWWSVFIIENSSLDSPKPENILSQIISILNGFSEAHIFVFDDYQWSDPYSKQLIESLCLNIPTPHKIILLSRDEYVINDQLANSHSIKIQPFSLDEIKELIKLNYQHINDEDSTTYATQTLEISNGHPLLTCESIAYLIKHKSFDSISSLSSISNLIETLILSTSLKNTPIDSDAFTLLRIVAEYDYDFPSKDIHSIVTELHLQTSIEDLTKLPFILTSPTGYYFSHDLYKQTILGLSSLKTPLKTYRVLAKNSSRRKQYKQASIFWSNANQDHRSYLTKLQALNEAFLINSPAAALDLVNDIDQGLNKYSISKEKHTNILWKIAQVEQLTGTIANAAKHYESFIRSHKINAKNHHLPLALIYYITPQNKFFSPSHLPKETCDQLSEATSCIIDFYTFYSTPLKTAKYIILNHRVSLLNSQRSEYKGFSYIQLAFLLYPLFRKKSTSKMLSLAKNEIATSEKNLLNLFFMETFLHLYSDEWHTFQDDIDEQITKAITSKLHQTGALIGMLKVLTHIDLGEAEEAQHFVDNDILSISAYLPSWFNSWYQQIKYALHVELSHPSKILFSKKDTLPIEIRAGAHLYYASAEASLANYAKSLQHLEVVLEYFEQMQYMHSAFTICIKPFIETPIILYFNGHLSRKRFNKFMSCARKHAKIVTRSRSLILGYKGIQIILEGNESKGKNMLLQACTDAAAISNISALRLFRLHLLFLFGETTHLIQKPNTGELVRVQAIWRSSTYQPHQAFLEIL